MLDNVTVGKNTVRILGHEFPIDNDLRIVKYDSANLAWRVETAMKAFPFNPIRNEQITVDTFRTYKTALDKSQAFDPEGRMKKMISRKEQGVRIIPGHGVFIMPSKMTICQRSATDLAIRVFAGTDLQQEFRHHDYAKMVLEAANYYYKHFRKLSTEINENLYYPVEYQVAAREFDKLTLPQGVKVTSVDGSFYVYCYYFGKTEYVGTAKSIYELKTVLEIAREKRYNKLKQESVYRWVDPRFIPLSQYLRNR